MANIEIQYTAVRGEGRSPEIAVATGKEAREPKTYILFYLFQWVGRQQQPKNKSRVQSLLATKMKKVKELVVANIEILQCVAREGPRRSIFATGIEAREPKIYILLVRRVKPSDY